MEQINSERELYNRVLPALRTKKHELNRSGIKIVTEKDIWLYNKYNNWRNVTGLSLAQMVADILNTSDSDYVEYKEQKVKEQDDINGR